MHADGGGFERPLSRIDHRGYPAYKETKGTYRFADYVLSIDHVQGDPFASPSRLSIRVSGKAAAFPAELYGDALPPDRPPGRPAAALCRSGRAGLLSGEGAPGHSGLISVSRCGQEVLERTGCCIGEDGGVLVRLEVGFPANGRTINARELEKILFTLLPRCVQGSLLYKNLDDAQLRAAADLAEDQQYIRDALQVLAFVRSWRTAASCPGNPVFLPGPCRGLYRFTHQKSWR